MWVAWPSGLRRWFKAPVSSEAWVRIPPLPLLFAVSSVKFVFMYEFRRKVSKTCKIGSSSLSNFSVKETKSLIFSCHMSRMFSPS